MGPFPATCFKTLAVASCPPCSLIAKISTPTLFTKSKLPNKKKKKTCKKLNINILTRVTMYEICKTLSCTFNTQLNSTPTRCYSIIRGCADAQPHNITKFLIIQNSSKSILGMCTHFKPRETFQYTHI